MVGAISAQTNAGYVYQELLGKVGTLKLRLSRNRFFFTVLLFLYFKYMFLQLYFKLVDVQLWSFLALFRI